MSVWGQFRPFGAVRGMSGLPPIADIEQTCWQVPTRGAAVRSRLTTKLLVRISELCREATSSKYRASCGSSCGLRRERSGRRSGDRPIVAKDHVPETPVRFHGNLKAERKITVAEEPLTGHGLDGRKAAFSERAAPDFDYPERPQTGRGAFLCRPGPPDRVTRYNPSRTGNAPTTPWLARGAGAGGHRLLLGIVNGPVSYMRMAVEARGWASDEGASPNPYYSTATCVPA
jgi:hypothetical protein